MHSNCGTDIKQDGKVLIQQENKLLDQEGRSQRENIRLYNVPERAEGTSMVLFVEKLLQDMLEHERAQQALDPKLSGDKEDKPWSIIIKFHYYKVNEEILPKG